MAKIGLCLIAKNEAHVIRQCLDSVAPLVDFVLISDTGSTDGTQDVCRAWMSERQIEGVLCSDAWVDFASNRNRALERLREYPAVDYALIMDADDLLTLKPSTDVASLKAGLDADVYMVEISDAGVRYDRPHLISNRTGHYYRGVLHEFLQSPQEAIRGKLAGVVIQSRRLGDRSRDLEKYQKDAQLLEAALWTETDEFMRFRYFFYLGQSYKDADDTHKAIVNYRARAEKGFWNDEIFISLYQIAQLMEAAAYPDDDVIKAYLAAADCDPRRAEPLHGAARFCRLKERHEQGYHLALRGLAIEKPASGLFVENWVYDHSLLDELSILAYWSGRYKESLDACVDLMLSDTFPPDQMDRLKMNAKFARIKVLPAWRSALSA